MKLSKIISAIAAGAVAMTMCAVSAFASTIELDSDYVGSWGAGNCIPKTELEAIGGDVKVTLDIETRNLANSADQFLIAPMDYDNGWTRVTDYLTTTSEYAKPDGFIAIKETQTSCEFVIPADTIATLGDSGLGFQVQNVIIKSAELEAGSPENAFGVVEDADITDFCFSELSDTTSDTTDEAIDTEVDDVAVEEVADTTDTADTTEDAAADTSADTAADDTAPASDNVSTSATTGNTPAAVIVSVMAVAAAAAAVSKKRK
jgi:hypothetical protein